MHTIPKHRKHPLKEEVQNLGLCLWQLREMLGGSPSEAKLSRYFNGIDKLPSELEHRLRHIISETKGFKNNWGQFMGRWLKIKTICERSDTSPRTVRKWIRAGLRHSRINGTVYVKEDWLDEFMEAHAVDNQQVDQTVQDVVKEFLK